MATRAPTIGQVGIAVAFAFSCFGLLLFLWSTFGGPIPFKPEGYRVKVPFQEATQLAVESDVRISNVSVGKVKKIELNQQTSTLKAPAVVECAIKVIKGLDFPPSSRGMETTVNYPYNFNPK